MTTPLEDRLLVAGLVSWWADRFPLNVPTVYPGTRIDAADVDEWIEFSLDGTGRRPGRAEETSLVDLTVTLHCFTKNDADAVRVNRLADAARSTLARQTVPLNDFELSGSPLVGYAKLQEAESTDLSRHDLDSLRHTMRHVVVSIRGVAQSV